MVIPANWLPDFHYSSDVKMIFHWTAGGYAVRDFEKEHYHLLIDGKGIVHKGFRPIGTPAPHTYGFNYEIGIALCAMAGAQSGHNHGDYPITKEQWETAAKVGAQLSDRYKIPINKLFCLSHAEVEEVLGVDQWGKWDIDELSFDPSIKNPSNDLRTRITGYLKPGGRESGQLDEQPFKFVIMSQDESHEMEALLMNSSSYVKARELHDESFLEIISVQNIGGKEGLIMTAKDWGTGDIETFKLMNVNGTGYMRTRDFEKFGYDISFNHEAKTIKAVRVL